MKLLRSLAGALFVFAIASVASASPRDAAQEAAIDGALKAIDPALVTLAHEGNAAMDRGDARTAQRAYAGVHEKAPEVAAITRRLCTAETRSGDPRAAIVHCTEAVTKQPDSAENHAALAAALLALPQPAQDDLFEARRQADAAAVIAPNTELAQATTCAVALRMGDATTLEICSDKLRRIAPTSPEAHLYAAFVRAEKSDVDGAKRELDAAHAAGLDDTVYAKMRADLEERTPQATVAEKIRAAILAWVPAAVAAWVAIVFVLLVSGMLLSDAATKKPSRVTRAIYWVVILASVGMFYVSAILGALVLAIAIAIVVILFLALVGATRAVEIGLALFGAYLLVATIRALFGRVAPRDLGTPVRRKQHPALRASLDALTKRARMEKIDEIRLVPDATIEVHEIGGVLGHLRGTNLRALVIGVAALEGLGTRAFEAVVASELLRFRSDGAAGGDVAIIERGAIDALVERMDARGVISMANPAWWLVSAYRAFFERITEGAVQRQDDAADARAAKAYGSHALVAGLKHLAKRRVEIEARASASLHAVLDGEDVPEDFFASEPETDIRSAIDEAVAELAEREALIAALAAEGYDEAEDAPAWELFADREAVEREMHDRLRTSMRDNIGLEVDQVASSESTVARA